MASSSSTHQSPETSSANAIVTYATLDEVLEDLSSRFILNLPDEELTALDRVCFQVEQAHWYYEDFIREQNPKFPSLPLKRFSGMLFHACPHLHQWSHDHEQAFSLFMQYKTRVPVCGAIMINETWEKCVLVKGWKSSSGWGFPKGKINFQEPPPACAVREVLEETGYNLAGQIVPEDVIEMSIKEQLIFLYIVQGVPEDFPFKTRTRKEISKIEWFKMTDLPTWRRNKTAVGKFYLITPFISALKAFVNQRKPRGETRRPPKPRIGPSLVETQQKQESSPSSAPVVNSHTSSPHFTPVQTVQTVTDDTLRSLAASATDPHFARLMSSLTLSVAPKSEERPAPAQTKVESDTESLNNSIVQDGHDNHDVDSSEPRTTSSLSNHSSPASKTLSSAITTPLDSDSSPIAKVIERHTLSSSAVLPRAPISRLSSPVDDGPSDIPRATATDSSALADRRLKQLALLQSVAMESARMTPKLENSRAGLTASPARPTTAAAFSDPSDLRVIYSSPGPPPVLNTPFPPSLPFPTQTYDDPFQVRPRTTQAFHRPHHQMHPHTAGSASMNQSALLNIMAQRSPPQGAYPYPHIHETQQSYYSPVTMPSTSTMPHTLNGPMQIQPPLHSFQPHPLPPQAQLGRPFQPVRRPSDPHLLSILNNAAANSYLLR